MNEFSSKKIGWSFNIFKTFIHVNIYQKILPKVFKKCVFAASIGFAANNKDIPFYELLDQESSEKSIMTLGGSQTLRGFKQGRFAAPVLQYDNFEMRIRFFQHNFFKQHFSFSAVPFFDMGGVWDSLDRMSHTENFRYSEGFGLRVGWNENTTLRFDFAVSKEDRQFFFALQQPF
jgi:outer membrane protein assembly factor BamA